MLVTMTICTIDSVCQGSWSVSFSKAVKICISNFIQGYVQYSLTLLSMVKNLRLHTYTLMIGHRTSCTLVRGLYSGSRVVSYGFWTYLSRASKFSFLLSSATQATSPCVTGSKAVASLKMVMQGLQTLRFGWTVLTG